MLDKCTIVGACAQVCSVQDGDGLASLGWTGLPHLKQRGFSRPTCQSIVKPETEEYGLYVRVCARKLIPRRRENGSGSCLYSPLGIACLSFEDICRGGYPGGNVPGQGRQGRHARDIKGKPTLHSDIDVLSAR